jgi:predicted esterase
MAKSFPANGLILPQDYETISAAYAVMLKKLNEVVPNIDASRSALAGFSNGAHTIGVLLAKQDSGILQQFHSFALLEGGMIFPMTMGGSAQLPDAFKNHRYFIMCSDVMSPTDRQAEAPLRTFEYNVMKQFCGKAKTNGFDFTFFTTHSGHHFGAEEKPVVADWIRQDSVTTPPAVK